MADANIFLHLMHQQGSGSCSRKTAHVCADSAPPLTTSGITCSIPGVLLENTTNLDSTQVPNKWRF